MCIVQPFLVTRYRLGLWQAFYLYRWHHAWSCAAYKHTERTPFITYEYLSHGIGDRLASRLWKVESRNAIQLEGNAVGAQCSCSVIRLKINTIYVCHVCSRNEAGANQVLARDGLLYRTEKLYNGSTFSLFSSNSHQSIDLNSKLQIHRHRHHYSHHQQRSHQSQNPSCTLSTSPSSALPALPWPYPSTLILSSKNEWVNFRIITLF